MYDLERDSIEVDNLVAVGSGEVRHPSDRPTREELGEHLAAAMRSARTDPGTIA